MCVKDGLIGTEIDSSVNPQKATFSNLLPQRWQQTQFHVVAFRFPLIGTKKPKP